MKRCIICFSLVFAVLLCGCVMTTDPVTEYSGTELIMDTVCTVRIGGDNAQEIAKAVFERIRGISEKTDYFSETSEVSKINQADANVPIELSEDVFNIIKMSLEISRRSEGAFDITLAPIKDLWNISGGAHKPPANEEIEKALSFVGYEKLILNEEDKTLTKTADGVKIDLGGAAKGYAADRAAGVLREYQTAYGIIDLGGNIYAFGKNPSRADGKWLIGIQEPFGKSGEYAETVLIDDGAVVTAGTYQRYFEWDGEKYHHIMSSKTGRPADSGVASASITSQSALLADCVSTACVVLGEEKGRALSEEIGCGLIIY
ncbi:MAG: FAD:protein FMN transferase [Clostridia bacterium]|nr:FAD:protein FMN transferase [Clostridia bacterium]